VGEPAKPGRVCFLVTRMYGDGTNGIWGDQGDVRLRESVSAFERAARSQTMLSAFSWHLVDSLEHSSYVSHVLVSTALAWRIERVQGELYSI
jgi:hypothetical protein